jgi:putative flippase GtrA
MSPAMIALRYALFAGLAMLANLAVQRAVLALVAGPAGLAYPAALAAGTGVGLVVKFVLDKRWIFFDRSAGAAAQGRLFWLYTLTGIATTAIFWGTETAFWLAWHTDAAREAGAVLGLAAGYIVKYRLDRRFVFAPAAEGAAA